MVWRNMVQWIYGIIRLFIGRWIGFFTSFLRSSQSFHRPKPQNITRASEQLPKNTRKPDWVRHELIRLAALMHGQSRRAVGRTFNRLYAERFGVSVGSSFTCVFLKTHALQVLRLRRNLRSRSPKVVPINHTWALDLTFFTDEAKITHASLGILDHGSRALLCLQTLSKRNSWTLLGYYVSRSGAMGNRVNSDPIMKLFLTHLCSNHFSA